MLIRGTEVDKKLSWALGTAERLARRGKLPHAELPDGSIRFIWSEIEPMIRMVPVLQKAAPCV